MAQGSEFPLRKPPGFHYDFFLLGITTFIAGLLGLPAPNGLIPQAPIHTTSLLVMGPSPHLSKKEDLESEPVSRARTPPIESETESSSGMQTRAVSRTGSIIHDSQPFPDPTTDRHRHEVPVAVVEQRVSNLAQGSLCLVLLTGPFLHVLNLIPRGVLAGLL